MTTRWELQNANRRIVSVADLFCGAGGSSSGAQRAIEGLGATMDLVAVNHWNTAIATHSANHPNARHLVEDVSLIDPEQVVPEGRLDLLMASPECRFYSRARGGKPIHDQGRMNPWVVHNWLTKIDVRRVIIENVPEFVDWGPLDENGRPDKARRGEHFQAWFLTFMALGYQAEWRLLNAADYGEATTRTRFFLMARNDGALLEWPEPTHGKSETPLLPGRLPWRGAREIIDWTNSGRSILDDPKYQRKPLSVKTRRRIARGLEKYGGPLAPLFIRLLDLPNCETLAWEANGRQQSFILNRHGDNGGNRAHGVHEPVPTITTRGGGYLVQTGASRFVGANRNENIPRSIDEPIPPVTTGGGGGIFLVEAEPRPFLIGQQSGAAPRDTAEPMPTIASAGAISLVRPIVIQYYGQSDVQDIDLPLAGITAAARKHGLVRPALVEYYGNSDAANIENPLPTVTAKARHGLVCPTIIECNHGNGPMGDKGDYRRAHSVEEPLPAITTAHGLALAQPIVVETPQTGANGRYSRSSDEPLMTVTTNDDLCLAVPVADPAPQPYIVPNFGECAYQEPRTHAIDDPLPTVTSRGAGNLVVPELDDPGDVPALDPNRLVEIDGQTYLLDIRFRMLQNPELARAMGFSDDESAYEFVGNVAEVTKQIGNAVPVNLAAALVRAILA